MTRFRWGSALDVGEVREVNQDSVLTLNGLFAVADGMGGHRGGEVASDLAVTTLEGRFAGASVDSLVAAVQDANTAIMGKAREDPDLRGMGTTISALALVRDGDRDLLGVVNVGDSRIYLLRADGADLEQVTEDHSLVATLERQGQLTSDEAALHPQRNILTRALGIDPHLLVDSFDLLPVTGDRYLICSDGLFNEVPEPKIAGVLRRLADPDEAAQELIRLAKENGGRDNISVVIVDVVDADASVAPATGDESRVLAIVHGEDRAGVPRQEVPPLDAPTASQPAVSARRPGREPGDAGREPDEADHSGPHGAGPRSRLTWRVGVFVLALVALGALTAGAITWIARNTFHVGLQGDQVVIFEGQPGGTLWIQPEVVAETGIERDEVPEARLGELEAGREEASRAEAEAYVENLREQIAAFEAERGDAPLDDGDQGEGSGVGGAVAEVPDAADPTTTAPAPSLP